MKMIIISDIHGITTNLNKIHDIFVKEQFDYLIVLGDIFSGNRKNKDYNPIKVEEFLLSFKDKLICLKGNCDLYEDINKLYIKNENIELYKIPNTNIYLSHGHKYNELNWYQDNTILITGHTHIPKISSNNSNIYICPGSISVSRAQTKESYLIYDNNNFMIYDINGNIINKI